jgi:hypothetical protein
LTGLGTHGRDLRCAGQALLHVRRFSEAAAHLQPAGARRTHARALSGSDICTLAAAMVRHADQTATDRNIGPGTRHRDCELRALYDRGQERRFDGEVLNIALLYIERDCPGTLLDGSHPEERPIR